MVFASRKLAAEQLATSLANLHLENPMLFALPRGGVVLGAEISKRLKRPLGVVLVRKIGHPMSPEYAIGAVAENEEPIYNPNEVTAADPRWLDRATKQARRAITERRALYCGGYVVTPLAQGRQVAIIDDGLATGLTMVAAAKALKDAGASYVVAAAPVASPESIRDLQNVADRIVVLDDPTEFRGSVGAHYAQFEQVNDEEVKQLLESSFENLCKPVK